MLSRNEMVNGSRMSSQEHCSVRTAKIRGPVIILFQRRRNNHADDGCRGEAHQRPDQYIFRFLLGHAVFVSKAENGFGGHQETQGGVLVGDDKREDQDTFAPVDPDARFVEAASFILASFCHFSVALPIAMPRGPVTVKYPRSSSHQWLLWNKAMKWR